MPPIQFPSGKVLDVEPIEEVQEKIKRVLKQELPEDYQTGEVFEHIFLNLEKQIRGWKIQLTVSEKARSEEEKVNDFIEDYLNS